MQERKLRTEIRDALDRVQGPLPRHADTRVVRECPLRFAAVKAAPARVKGVAAGPELEVTAGGTGACRTPGSQPMVLRALADQIGLTGGV